MSTADTILRTSIRLDSTSRERLSNMLTENPLYTQSKLLRGLSWPCLCCLQRRVKR
ncbi:hypothetical protein SODG_005873 [Sodalis praecaptivus]